MNNLQDLAKPESLNKILDDIHNNKCILFLGPLMPSAEHKGRVRPLMEVYSDRLIEDLAPVTTDLGEEVKTNPYFLYTKYSTVAGGRSNLEKKIKTYHGEYVNNIPVVYDELAKLPFNTIINFGCDRTIQNALNRQGHEFSDKYYNYKGNYQQYLEGLDDNLQLVYNLLGTISDINSQVLTEDDQLLFMRNIVGGPKLPDNVLSRIKDPDNAKSYLFLGFNFEEWPFRFLLDVLQLPKTKSSASSQLANHNIALMTREFYYEKFGLNFIDLDPDKFAVDLVEAYGQRHDMGRHVNGYLAYHDYDEPTFKQFKEYLKNSKLGKRIVFWSRDEILTGDITNETLQDHLEASTVFIAFISMQFLNDQALANQLRTMLAREDILIFPIIVSNCDFETDFPSIKLRSSIILPGEDKVLINSIQPVSAADYVSMTKIINSKIR
jgi:hypothetical protein